jgi:hypothetical protein
VLQLMVEAHHTVQLANCPASGLHEIMIAANNQLLKPLSQCPGYTAGASASAHVVTSLQVLSRGGLHHT